jgi:hypothetical protein
MCCFKTTGLVQATWISNTSNEERTSFFSAWSKKISAFIEAAAGAGRPEIGERAAARLGAWADRDIIY